MSDLLKGRRLQDVKSLIANEPMTWEQVRAMLPHAYLPKPNDEGRLRIQCSAWTCPVLDFFLRGVEEYDKREMAQCSPF